MQFLRADSAVTVRLVLSKTLWLNISWTEILIPKCIYLYKKVKYNKLPANALLIMNNE